MRVESEGEEAPAPETTEPQLEDKEASVLKTSARKMFDWTVTLRDHGDLPAEFMGEFKLGGTYEVSDKERRALKGYKGLVSFEKQNEPYATRKLKRSSRALLEERERDAQMSSYVFDPTKVYRSVIFPFCRLDEDEFAYGLMLPSNVPERDRSGKPTGQIDQIWVPVLITNSLQALSSRDLALRKRLVKVKNPPEHEDDYPRRWSLTSIKRYLDGEYERIEASDVFSRIRSLYSEYLYFSPDYWYDIHALWDMMTYSFMLFQYIPILELRGMSGTAKTKIMSLSRQITFNATEEMTDVSAATLFRLTDSQRPTKYVDEAERLFPIVQGKIEPDERAELINASYKYSGAVPRQEKIGNRYKTVNYSVYSPTMIGSIRGLHGATENRAIVHVTQKHRPGDPRAGREPDPEDPRFSKLRDDLYVFTLQNAGDIKCLYDAYDDPRLEGRELTLLKPLLVLARMVSDDLHERMLPVLSGLLSKRSMNSIGEGSWEYAALKAVRDIVLDGFYDKEDSVVLLKTIISRMDVDGDRKPGSKALASVLDKFGFLDLKDRWNDGVGYRGVNLDFIGSIVVAQCPELVNERMRSADSPSFHSLPSLLDDNEGEEKDEKVKEVKYESEASEENEANEGHSVNALSSQKLADRVGDRDVLISDLLREGYSEASINRALELGDIYELRAGIVRKLAN